MVWNAKTELLKKAVVVAKETHPEGFNKSQLIEASKEVYGGFGANTLKEIKTLEDVSHAGNAMAQIDGHYPVGMSGCYVVGINGGCGYECPVFLNGDCDEHQQQMLTDLVNPEISEHEPDEIAEIFAEVGEDLEEFLKELAYV